MGYVSSFDDQSDFSDYEDPRVYRDWDDWRDTDALNDSGVLPPEDGEAESPCPCSPDEVAMRLDCSRTHCALLIFQRILILARE